MKEEWTHDSTSYEKMTIKEIEFLSELSMDMIILNETNAPFDFVVDVVKDTVKKMEASSVPHSRRRHFEAKVHVDHESKTIEVRRDVKDRDKVLLTTVKQE